MPQRSQPAADSSDASCTSQARQSIAGDWVDRAQTSQLAGEQNSATFLARVCNRMTPNSVPRDRPAWTAARFSDSIPASRDEPNVVLVHLQGPAEDLLPRFGVPGGDHELWGAVAAADRARAGAG